MNPSITIVILFFILFSTISSENLDGIFLIDSCKCNSSTETCEPKGPFLFNQKRATLSVKYGSTQIGVGSLGKGQVDLYLNRSRCKGIWNSKDHLAEFQCQQNGGVICLTKIRCISGPCLDDTSIDISSASILSTAISLFLINIFILLV